MWAQCKAVAPDSDTLDAGGCYVKGKSVMVPPKVGAFGTMGRNIFRDTAFKNGEFSVFKDFAFKERYHATFRAEFFNIFNRPTISNPYGASNGYGGASGGTNDMGLPAHSAAGAPCPTLRQAIRSSAREAV
jgi:hypothetical protein